MNLNEFEVSLHCGRFYWQQVVARLLPYNLICNQFWQLLGSFDEQQDIMICKYQQLVADSRYLHLKSVKLTFAAARASQCLRIMDINHIYVVILWRQLLGSFPAILYGILQVVD
eukprot:TRINITY_DN5970_c1_g1_i1.p4 TRINITY_DN5970_c1_g1~~TRINITY_DN5970_c1_g1_i1.p4  ORF type:complete len:114 (-),score=6.46 TRINITY_DN5970_c1_g1_i1:3-344(-)